MLYIVVKYQTPTYNTFWDMNYCLAWQTDRQTESDAYEPTVQYVQVGSKIYTEMDTVSLTSPDLSC